MCESVYENAHAERINGTIKNGYLIHYGPQDYNQLIAMTTKAVMKYNLERPHQSLGNMSPNQFEKSLPVHDKVINNGFKRKKVTKKEKTQECV